MLTTKMTVQTCLKVYSPNSRLTSRSPPRRLTGAPSRPRCRAWWWRWGPQWWTSSAPCWAGTCTALHPPAGPWRCEASTSSWTRRERRRSFHCVWWRGCQLPGWLCCLPGPSPLGSPAVIRMFENVPDSGVTHVNLTDHTDEGGVLAHLHCDVLHVIHEPRLHTGPNWE